MSFKEKYVITPKYLTPNTKRRSGILISPTVKFIVAHDTGNPRSTAAGNIKYYESSRDAMEASAHIFVDDKEILECIPAVTLDKPEKAWHVYYQLSTDNKLYSYNANDVAIGVEYCYGDNIDANEAYQRYIWVIAYICYKFNLDPKNSIVGHHILDPGRKFDPESGLRNSGRSYKQLLADIVSEYNTCNSINQEKDEIKTIINNKNNFMRLIKNKNSNKVYAIGEDNKKHWIFNGETLEIGREMGLWSGIPDEIDDDKYVEGHALFLINYL